VTGLDSLPGDDGQQLEDLTTRDLARVMVRIQRLRWAKVRDLEALTAELAAAKKAATVVHARAFLAADGPQDERTQTAKLAAADAVFGADVVRGKLDACKASMETLRDDWDTCRSVNSNQRAEKNAIEGYGAS